MSLKTGPWKLSDLNSIRSNGLKVFSCFHCGGGSTMGYKLAGFDVLGGVDIDRDMVKLYRKNHNPKLSYQMGIQRFNRIPDHLLPKELFELDVLDGSPPCSSFSMSGAREKKWGKESKFREGQAVQVLDDLFFHFIDTAKRLQPKVVVAENVKGMLAGNARFYVKKIFKHFSEAGYDCQLFLLNAASMGVPQKRERVFFIGRRQNLELPSINLNFSEKPIPFAEATHDLPEDGNQSKQLQKNLWESVKVGESFSKAHPKGSFFNAIKIDPNQPVNTFAAAGGSGGLYHHQVYRKLNRSEITRIQTFPDDYDFLNISPQYLCGMSVPPFMMQRIADQIFEQWLSKLVRESGLKENLASG